MDAYPRFVLTGSQVPGADLPKLPKSSRFRRFSQPPRQCTRKEKNLPQIPWERTTSTSRGNTLFNGQRIPGLPCQTPTNPWRGGIVTSLGTGPLALGRGTQIATHNPKMGYCSTPFGLLRSRFLSVQQGPGVRSSRTSCLRLFPSCPKAALPGPFPQPPL
jgi:hypothetical protein